MAALAHVRCELTGVFCVALRPAAMPSLGCVRCGQDFLCCRMWCAISARCTHEIQLPGGFMRGGGVRVASENSARRARARARACARGGIGRVAPTCDPRGAAHGACCSSGWSRGLNCFRAAGRALWTQCAREAVVPRQQTAIVCTYGMTYHVISHLRISTPHVSHSHLVAWGVHCSPHSVACSAYMDIDMLSPESQRTPGSLRE